MSLHKYKAHLHQEILQQQEQEYCESYAFKAELSTSCQSDIPSIHSPTSLVVNSNHALSDFIECEERCSKFIMQNLNFLQSSNISSVSKDVLSEDNLSVQVSWPENQGILFFYISKTLEMIRISFLASLLNAVL